MFYICIFSNKFNLNQATCVSHTGAQQFLQNPTPYTLCINTFYRNKNMKPKPHYLISCNKRRGTSEVKNSEKVIDNE
jgi:hypothetical protein